MAGMTLLGAAVTVILLTATVPVVIAVEARDALLRLATAAGCAPRIAMLAGYDSGVVTDPLEPRAAMVMRDAASGIINITVSCERGGVELP